MPAPPPESEPAMVRARGYMSCSFYLLLCKVWASVFRFLGISWLAKGGSIVCIYTGGVWNAIGL